MEFIRSYMERSHPLSDEDWAYFSARLTTDTFPAKQVLLRAGQVENYLSFIETGIVRFYQEREENDLTFAFAFSNGFVSAYDSFLTQSACSYATETLTPTVLYRMTYADLQDVYAHTAAGNTIGRLAGEELFLKKSRRELSLLNETAEERYLKLFTEQPQLIRHIPLKYIASYIGITPQALSRIRRRIS